jgi:23S rRNA (adenine2503-C2)-methyltransferase
MGMGEPMMNYKNVVDAIRKITQEDGLGMSARRITVSTSGIPKMMKMLADENLKVKLALSLHSAIEHKRNEIMPFSTKFPLTEIMEAMQYWYDKTGSRITFEYCVWKGINDGDEDIKALIKYCKQVPCKVNLIQYNPIGEGKFDHRSVEAEEKYIRELEKAGITALVRRSRGGDIDAACGQLANKNSGE